MAKITHKRRFKVSVKKFRLIESDEYVFSVVNNKTQVLLRYLLIENKLVGLFTLQSRCQNPNSILVLPPVLPV